jgi:hypothetical protein
VFVTGGRPDRICDRRSLRDTLTAMETFAKGDRVRLIHDFTFGERFYPAGTTGEVEEADVVTYGATEHMTDHGVRVRFDGDANPTAAWASYTVLERASD